MVNDLFNLGGVKLGDVILTVFAVQERLVQERIRCQWTTLSEDILCDELYHTQNGCFPCSLGGVKSANETKSWRARNRCRGTNRRRVQWGRVDLANDLSRVRRLGLDPRAVLRLP